MTAPTEGALVLDLNSPKSALAAQLAADLDRTEKQRAEVEQEALAGRMTADTLSRIDADRNLLRLRAETAQREADAELDALASEDELTAAIDELVSDNALSVTPIAEALEALTKAAEEVDKATAARDAALRGWVQRLKSLGVPEHGLTVDGKDIQILAASRVGGAPRIGIGGGEVSETYTPARYIKYAVSKWLRVSDAPVSPAGLTNHDRRAEVHTDVVEARLLRPLSGRSAGDVLTSNNMAVSAIARLVNTGHAELIRGEIPDADLQTQIILGSRARDQDRQENIAIAQAIAAGAY